MGNVRAIQPIRGLAKKKEVRKSSASEEDGCGGNNGGRLTSLLQDACLLVLLPQFLEL